MKKRMRFAPFYNHMAIFWSRYLLFLLLGVTFYIRFKNLGYSEYCLDEPGSFIYKGAMSSSETPLGFLLRQRKGPMQFVFSLIPRVIVGNYNNELAQRVPFALASVFAVFGFYLAIEKLTNKKLLAFIAAAFFSVNGFVVAFGRTAQYQSLNMLFSFFAVYFYAFLLPSTSSSSDQKVLIKKSLWGTFFLCLSILSHWDAMYVLPLVIFIFIKFLISLQHSSKFKLKLIWKNVFVGLLILLPFFIPYLSTYFQNESNQVYLNSRLGAKGDLSFDLNLDRIALYNPFFVFDFYIIFGVLGVFVDVLGLFWKRFKTPVSGLFTLWFIFVGVMFYFYVPYAGTHIYNLLIPMLLLASLGIYFLFELFPHVYKSIPLAIFLLAFSFFWCQSYVIYTDISREYPWDTVTIWGFKTKAYTHEDVVVQRNKLGFHINRNWKEIAKFLNDENESRGEEIAFITNDYSSLAKFYVDLEYSHTNLPYYVVGIKKPSSFVNDYSFSTIKGKHTIKKISVGDETVAQIYLVDGEK